MSNYKADKKLPLPLVAGHVFECFDNTLYGFFAVLLAPLFFPSYSVNGAILASFATFAVGFLGRPVGAFFFGYIGDKYGRRTPLMWSMLLVGIPTFIIGILPPYATIGVIAPVLLVLCRLAQGFCMGGEFTAINLYIYENYSEGVGKQTGILISAGVYGAVLSTALGAICTLEHMPVWGWRVPFILGGIFSIIVYFYRRNIKETAQFNSENKKHEVFVFPWKVLFLNFKKEIFIGIVIAGLTIIPLYLSTIFGNRLFQSLGYSHSQSMLLNMIAMILNAVMVQFCGLFADRFGFYKQMLFGTVTTALIAFPAFLIISGTEVGTLDVFLFIIIMVIGGCIINGCVWPYIASFFPTRSRFSAMAFCVTIGQVIGGFTPMIASYLTDASGKIWMPSTWMIGMSVISFFGILILGTPSVQREKNFHEVV